MTTPFRVSSHPSWRGMSDCGCWPVEKKIASHGTTVPSSEEKPLHVAAGVFDPLDARLVDRNPLFLELRAVAWVDPRAPVRADR